MLLLPSRTSTYGFVDLFPLLFAQVIQMIPRLLLLRSALLTMLWRLWPRLVLAKLGLSFTPPRYCLAEMLNGRGLSELWVIKTRAIGQFRGCGKVISRWKGREPLRPGSHCILLKRCYRVQTIMLCYWGILVPECVVADRVPMNATEPFDALKTKQDLPRRLQGQLQGQL